MTDFNDRLYLVVNAFARHTPWLHGPVTAFAKYGVLLFGLAIVVTCFRSLRTGPRALAASFWAGAGTVLAVAVNQPLGHLFGVARPYVAHPDALLLVHRTSDFSFPSDHAVMAGAVAVGLIIVSRRWAAVGLAAALLMAAARVYVGAHYPADVLAGLLVGALVSVVGWLLCGSMLTRLAGFTRVGRSRSVPGTPVLPD